MREDNKIKIGYDDDEIGTPEMFGCFLVIFFIFAVITFIFRVL